jgi:ATP-dependent Lon protease
MKEAERAKVEEIKRLEEAIKMKSMKKELKKEMKSKALEAKMNKLKAQLEEESDDDEEIQELKQTIKKKHAPAKPAPTKANNQGPIQLTREQVIKAFGF